MGQIHRKFTDFSARHFSLRGSKDGLIWQALDIKGVRNFLKLACIIAMAHTSVRMSCCTIFYFTYTRENSSLKLIMSVIGDQTYLMTTNFPFTMFTCSHVRMVEVGLTCYATADRLKQGPESHSSQPVIASLLCCLLVTIHYSIICSSLFREATRENTFRLSLAIF